MEEKVLGEAKISSIIGSIIGVLLFALLILCIVSFVILDNGVIPSILCFVIFIWGVATVTIKVNTTKLYYTNKRVVGKSGLLSKQILDTPLNKVNTILVKKSILGYGTIIISSSSGKHKFNYIANAEQLKNGIMEEMDKYNQTLIQEQAEAMAKAMKEAKQ